jgi:hypothetical protein|tara:strand:+ start:892 stop:1107 length:216 start_codon:yes stop_codon:yes gene_type:complete
MKLYQTSDIKLLMLDAFLTTLIEKEESELFLNQTGGDVQRRKPANSTSMVVGIVPNSNYEANFQNQNNVSL